MKDWMGDCVEGGIEYRMENGMKKKIENRMKNRMENEEWKVGLKKRMENRYVGDPVCKATYFN